MESYSYTTSVSEYLFSRKTQNSTQTVTPSASDDSHLPVVLAGNLELFLPGGICRAKKSHNRPALVRWFGLRLGGEFENPARHRPQGNALKTTRLTTAKSSIHAMDIRVVG